MELIMQVLNNLFSIHTLVICTLGTVAGVVLGAIPGMNGGIGIAVMLPFTYSMRPEQGLLFLGGHLSGVLLRRFDFGDFDQLSGNGGSLLHRAGGLSHDVLYYSIIASGVGSIIGLVVLLFFAPVLSSISVKFGPPEMFLLSICGLTIVGSLTGKNVSKGLIAALIGLFLAMIGMDNTTGAMRFIFGTKTLRGGINLIPAVIGLFAIAEMIKQGIGIGRGGQENSIRKLTDFKFVDIWKETWRKYSGVLLKSSAIGTFIGILPGTGGAIAAFLAYGEAKGRDKEGTFGQGNPAGIIAPESANNAAVGGSLVPMLSLGIPGSSTSAIMFGALTIHGLVPGQRLFVEHGDVAYSFMIGMFLTAIIMLLVGVFGIPLFASILKLNIRQIIPVVIMCSLIGAYSVNNS